MLEGSDAGWEVGGGKGDFNDLNKRTFKKLYCFAKKWRIPGPYRRGGMGVAMPTWSKGNTSCLPPREFYI